MEFKHLLIVLSLVTIAHSISTRCNISTLVSNSILNNNANDFYIYGGCVNRLNVHPSILSYNKTCAFLKPPNLNNLKFNTKVLKFKNSSKDDLNNSNSSYLKQSSSDFNVDQPGTDDVYNYDKLGLADNTNQLQNSASPLNQPSQSNLNVQSDGNQAEDFLYSPDSTNPLDNKNATLCKLVKYDEGIVQKFLSKLNVKQNLSLLNQTLERARNSLANALYPSGASKEVIKFTNWKILERIFISLASTVALNVKPLTIFDSDSDKDLVGFLKNKITKTKMSTLLFTSVFKDLFSRILNYYWFNKAITVSDNPSKYRMASTFCHSLLTLWDFFINFNSLEPKPVLLAINHVFKQMFTQTNNAINQDYYNKNVNYLNTAYKLFNSQNTNESNSLDPSLSNKQSTNTELTKLNVANRMNLAPKEYKDEYVFMFDILGMSLGMGVSYLINEANSNELKMFTIASNLVLNNILTMILTKFLK